MDLRGTRDTRAQDPRGSAPYKWPRRHHANNVAPRTRKQETRAGPLQDPWSHSTQVTLKGPREPINGPWLYKCYKTAIPHTSNTGLPFITCKMDPCGLAPYKGATPTLPSDGLAKTRVDPRHANNRDPRRTRVDSRHTNDPCFFDEQE